MSVPSWIRAWKSRLTRTGSRTPIRNRRANARPRLTVLEDRAVPATFTVLNANDSGPDSLRQAILDANASPGMDTIAFNIPGGGVHTITPGATSGTPTGLGSLPPVTDPVLIDGYSQPGASWNTLAAGDNAVLTVELSGDYAGAGAIGLTIYGGDSTVQGLVVNNFDADGILLAGGDHDTVKGCFVGTDAAGTNPKGNAAGVGGRVPYNSFNAGVQVLSSFNLIGGFTPADRNVISGNHAEGITVNGSNGPSQDDYAGAFHNQVSGNFIGTDRTGTQALGNDSDGIAVISMRESTPGPRPSPDTIIGGTTPGARNIISGNRGVTYLGQNGSPGSGIYVAGGDGTLIEGNYIGTDVTGMHALGNDYDGVFATFTSRLSIGGLTAVPGMGPGNVISGNQAYGVQGGGTGFSVQGNLIGTDATGTIAIVPSSPNGYAAGGVFVGGTGTLVGGTAPGARNVVVTRNGFGIRLGGASNSTIQGNYIGLDITGNQQLPIGNGVAVNDGSHDNLIGGTTSAARNVLANCDIQFTGAAFNNTVQGNYIGLNAAGSQARRGLEDDGITLNGSGVHDNLIGGTAPGAGNVVTAGVVIMNSSHHNTVQGNLVGTDAAGHVALGAGHDTGVVMLNGAHDNLVGGTEADARNVISGNFLGHNIQAVWIDETSHHNTVAGNFIGTDITGTAPLGNYNGVVIYGSNNTVGGTAPGAGNVIAFNSNGCVVVRFGTGNVIRGNSIHDNNGPGIVLRDGGNNGQPAPVLTAATFSPDGTAVSGTLASSAGTYTLELFANDTADATGYWEGKTSLGAIAVTVGADGHFTATGFGALPPGQNHVTATVTDAAGNTSAFSNQVVAVPANSAPTANAGGPYAIMEGGSLTLNASASHDPDVGDTLTYSWDVNGDGTFGDATGVTPTLTWAQLVALGLNDGPRTVTALTVRVDDGHGHVVDSATTMLALANAPPVAGISGPSSGVRGQSLTYTLTAADPSPIDQAAGFTFRIDWDGDGTTDQIVSGPSGTTVDHNFINTGSYTVRVTAEDKDHDVSTSATQGVPVVAAMLQPDPSHPGTTDLVVGGTPGDDLIVLAPASGSGVVVWINGSCVGTFQPTGRLIAYGYTGNDAVAAVGCGWSAYLFGGDGNDLLSGGSGNNVLVGGNGDDLLTGFAGRDLLIGGAGADVLAGGTGDDILIAGTTAFDTDVNSLAAIMAEWTSSHDYTVRLANLRGTGTGTSFTNRLNGNVFLHAAANAQGAATVFGDASLDVLTGGGGRDWFFANVSGGGLHDWLLDENGNEIVDDVP